ncbi:MAG: hypothetical protein V2J42_07920 [Wenzhouxiangella sp.]|nr:hypothetical protein [Wenzhouxiangella sp.]
MNVFSFIVALTALYMVYALGEKWLAARRHRPEEVKRIEDELQALRERVETLERIVTDQRETLRQKFDEL